MTRLGFATRQEVFMVRNLREMLNRIQQLNRLPVHLALTPGKAAHDNRLC
jgi:hypothetical protein